MSWQMWVGNDDLKLGKHTGRTVVIHNIERSFWQYFVLLMYLYAIKLPIMMLNQIMWLIYFTANYVVILNFQLVLVDGKALFEWFIPIK